MRDYCVIFIMLFFCSFFLFVKAQVYGQGQVQKKIFIANILLPFKIVFIHFNLFGFLKNYFMKFNNLNQFEGYLKLIIFQIKYSFLQVLELYKL